ncbi:hypothetical protein BC834DRAFT_846777 [Gloeopeniophorella convolvens]|nr:hypothetical protein BC834DRAFT_846777 [Gloeopeniophorella convolvens]
MSDSPGAPDAAEIERVVREIVSEAKQKNRLSDLTPRLVRSSAEVKLGLESSTLDAPSHKALVKRAIHNAMTNESETEKVQESTGKDKGTAKGKKEKEKDNGAKLKDGQRKRAPQPKPAAKSKLVISDSEVDDEHAPSSSKSKIKSDGEMDVDEESKPARPSSKAKASSAKADKSPRSNAKRKRASAHVVEVLQSHIHSDGEVSDATPKGTSSPAVIDMDDKEKSDSEMSSLVDEPSTKDPQPKRTRTKKVTQPLSKDEETLKRLKSFVVACGVRKQWTREFSGMSALSAQIAHVRRMLTDLGMVGRPSMEQARAIREKREMAQELDDVQKFSRAIVAGRPFAAEAEAGGRSTRRKIKGKGADDARGNEDAGSDASERAPATGASNARRSIMAFLEDQSSDGE